MAQTAAFWQTMDLRECDSTGGAKHQAASAIAQRGLFAIKCSEDACCSDGIFQEGARPGSSQVIPESIANATAEGIPAVEVLYVGKCCNAGENGWLFGRHFNGDERGWLPSAAVGEVATTKQGYISLKRGEEICVEHLGSDASGDAGWLFGESPHFSGQKGWFPIAMVHTCDSIAISVKLALNGELLAVIRLQPSDTLDTLRHAVSVEAGNGGYVQALHHNGSLEGAENIVSAGLASGSVVDVVRLQLPSFLVKEKYLAD